MRSRQVRKGRAARDRRYEGAVRRQITLVRHARTVAGPAADGLYADPQEFLRRGDTLDRFGYQDATVHTGRYAFTCYDCGLPDPHRGHGDGIGSCDCPRCRDCGGAPGDCGCDDDLDEDDDCCGDPDCACWGPPARPMITVDTGGLL